MNESDARWICNGSLRPSGTSLGGGLSWPHAPRRSCSPRASCACSVAARVRDGCGCTPQAQAAASTRSTSARPPPRASRGSVCCDAPPPRPRPARSSPSRGSARHRATDAGRRGRPGVADHSDARRGVPQGQHRAGQAAAHDGTARVPAQRPHPPHHRRRTRGARVEHNRKVLEKGVEDALLPARPRGSARTDGGDAQARLAGWAGSTAASTRWTGWRSVTGERPPRRDSAVRRPKPAS